MPAELEAEEKKALSYIKRRKPENVEEAAYEIAEKYGLDLEKSARILYRLWKKGFIDILPEEKYSNFPRYVFSLDSLWFWILALTIAATVLLVFYVKEPPLLYARYVLGSLYVLYLPGATLIEALYPRGEELEPLERLALSIGLSLAVVPLVGLVLNYTPWGIRLEPVTLSLALLSMALAFFALKRKYDYVKISD